MPVASLLWRKAISAAPLLPTGRIGDAVRYGVIKTTRRAPLKLAIANGDTVVQVGATGRGEIWEMSRLAGPNGRLIVIEPAPENLEAIYERIERDGIET
jgi:hypothetical protein